MHDKVFVTKRAGTPSSLAAPTGPVIFHRYSTIDCSGTSVDQTVPLGGRRDGRVRRLHRHRQHMSYKADYQGDALYPARAGACEPLTVTPVCTAGTFTLTGNSASTGTRGNIRQFTATNNAQVRASGFNRTTGGSWSTGWLGSYPSGLGVTNANEDGSDPSHKVDNVDSVDYVLFEFSTGVVVDRVYLDAVTTDSDISVWIGNKTDAFTKHQTLSDSFLSSLGFTEENLTTSTASRWADINAGGVKGNILVIAALASDTSPEDQFKINQVSMCS